MRPLVVLLLILNLGVLVWGWSRDRPIDAPLPPLPRTPVEIELLTEGIGTEAISGSPASTPAPNVLPGDGPAASARSASVPTPSPRLQALRATSEPAPIQVGPSAPASAYEGRAIGQLPQAPLPDTFTERVDPGLLPEELDEEPPIVRPPVREDDLGATSTWAR